MLVSLLIFLPVGACLFWTLIHCLMGSRTYTFWAMFSLLLAAAVFLVTDSFYSDVRIGSRALVYCSLFAQASAPCIIPLLWIYLKKVRREEELKAHHMAWLAVPLMLFTAAVLLIMIAGQRDIEQFLSRFHTERFEAIRSYRGEEEYFYYVVVVYVFRLVILGQTATLLWRMLHLRRAERFSAAAVREFLTGNGRISVLQLQYLNVLMLIPPILAKTILFRWMLIRSPWISILLAVLLVLLISQFAYFGLFTAKRTLSRQDLRNAFRFNYSSATKAATAEEIVGSILEDADEETLRRIRELTGQEGPADAEQEPASGDPPAAVLAGSALSGLARTWDPDSLMGRFEKLMFDEQLFLQPGLTLMDVAERLHSNKTYVSRLVNNTYNLAFPDLLNTLRIDYAEQYIINHRGAKQIETATACGFPSASSFNSTFKKVTGMTPKIWLATYERHNSTGGEKNEEQE